MASLRESNYAEWTVHSVAREVRLLPKWLEQEGLLGSIVRQGDLPKPPAPNPKPLAPAELQTLLLAAGSSEGWLARRDVAIVATLADSGLRRGELLQMTTEQGLVGSGVVKQKGGSLHRFTLAPETCLLVREYLRAIEKAGFPLEPNAPLWRAQDGRPLTPNGLRQIFRRFSKRLGQRVYPHQLRATAATLRLAQGVPTEIVRQGLGHRDARSIAYYARVAETDADRLLRESNPLRLISRKPRE